MKKRGKRFSFDCIAAKRAAQARIYAETRRMSGPELIEYYRTQAQTGPLSGYWNKALRSGNGKKRLAG